MNHVENGPTIDDGDYLRFPVAALHLPTGSILYADGNRVLLHRHGRSTYELICGNTEVGCRTGERFDARFDSIGGLCISPDGDLFISDTGNNRIVRLFKNGIVAHYFGKNPSIDHKGEPKKSESLFRPRGLCLALSGDLIVADSGNHVIRRIDRVTKLMTTIAGRGNEKGEREGWVDSCLLNEPISVRMGYDAELLVVTRRFKDDRGPLLWAVFPSGKVNIIHRFDRSADVLDAVPDYDTGRIVVVKIDRGNKGIDSIRFEVLRSLKTSFDFLLKNFVISSADDPLASLYLSNRLYQERKVEEEEEWIEALDYNEVGGEIARLFEESPPHSPSPIFEDPNRCEKDSRESIFTSSRLFHASGVRDMLQLLYQALRITDINGSHRPLEVGRSKFKGIIQVIVEGEDEYSPRFRCFVRYNCADKFCDLIRSVQLESDKLEEPIFFKNKNIIVLAPDGDEIDEEAPIGAVVRDFECEMVTFTNGVPSGSCARPMPTCARLEALLPRLSFELLFLMQIKRPENRLRLRAPGDTFFRIPDHRCGYARRIPLTFRVTYKELMCSVTFERPITTMADAEEEKSKTNARHNFLISTGYCLRKIARIARIIVNIPIANASITKTWTIDNARRSEGRVQVEAKFVLRTNTPLCLLFKVPGVESPISIILTQDTVLQPILESILEEYNVETREFRVLRKSPTKEPTTVWLGATVAASGLVDGSNVEIEKRDSPNVLALRMSKGEKTLLLKGFESYDRIHDVIGCFRRNEGIEMEEVQKLHENVVLQPESTLHDQGINPAGGIVTIVVRKAGCSNDSNSRKDARS